MVIFGINFPLRKNIGGALKNFNVSTEIQTFLNGTIVTKITPLNGVFVITNFVI